jgi:hypothetical protein
MPTSRNPGRAAWASLRRAGVRGPGGAGQARPGHLPRGGTPVGMRPRPVRSARGVRRRRVCSEGGRHGDGCRIASTTAGTPARERSYRGSYRDRQPSSVLALVLLTRWGVILVARLRVLGTASSLLVVVTVLVKHDYAGVARGRVVHESVETDDSEPPAASRPHPAKQQPSRGPRPLGCWGGTLMDAR